MVSGPGCPVCITPGELHEAAIQLVTGKGEPRPRDVRRHDPGSDRAAAPSKQPSPPEARPSRSSIRPDESLELARRNKDKEIVFFGVGFETTIPSIALAAKTAGAGKTRPITPFSPRSG